MAAGVARQPVRALFLRAGTEVSGGESVESAAGDAELIGSLRSFQPALSKSFEHIPDEGRRVTTDELLVVFRTGSIPARLTPAASLFVGLRYAQASSKTGGGGELSCFANYTTCPLCSHRDSQLRTEDSSRIDPRPQKEDLNETSAVGLESPILQDTQTLRHGLPIGSGFLEECFKIWQCVRPEIGKGRLKCIFQFGRF
jgi:hypothetical protein